MPFCTACGRQNPDDARFCAQCGTRLATDVSSTGSNAAVPEPTSSLLAWWAADEVLRGVNPWRRCLGAAVLAMLVLRLFA